MNEASTRYRMTPDYEVTDVECILRKKTSFRIPQATLSTLKHSWSFQTIVLVFKKCILIGPALCTHQYQHHYTVQHNSPFTTNAARIITPNEHVKPMK